MNIEWSEEGRAELFAAYAKAQSEMGEVVKTSTNPAFTTTQRTSKYADLSAVTAAVMPAMSKNGLAVIQSPNFDGESVTVETVVGHGAGGFFRSSISLRPTKVDPQGIGSAITYARRYALMALAGVAPEDDDGNAASEPGEPGKRFERDQRQVSAPGRKSSAAVVAAKNAILASPPEKLADWATENANVLAEISKADRDEIMEFYHETTKPFVKANEPSAEKVFA